MLDNKLISIKYLLLFLIYGFTQTIQAQNQQVYWMGQSDLINSSDICGNGIYGGTNPGFSWVDNLPSGTQVVSIQVEYNVGLNCDIAEMTLNPTLNLVSQTSVTYIGECGCDSTNQTYITHTLNNSNYNVGGTNTYVLEGAGFAGFNDLPTSLQGNFAKVTVTYGADNDAGIQTIALPASFCAQTKNITVGLKNFGNNVLNSASIQWEINGTPQTTISYNSPLAPNAAANVILASNYNFTNGSYIITARTTNPNNTSDGNSSNNELTATINVGAYPPTAIAHSEVTAGSVYAVSWNGDPSQSYDIQYGPFNFALGTGTIVSNISGISQNISGINPNLNGYDVYVRSYCGATLSSWSAKYSFGTVPFYVSNEAQLNAALSASVNGDVIIFLNDIVVTSEKSISGKTITINGQGHELSVPRPGLDEMGRFNSDPSSFRVLQLSSAANVTINRLTIKGGSISGSGGAILINSGTTLKINNSVVSNSNAVSGGGGISIAGTLFMKNSFVRRNAANYGGGIIVSGGRAYVEESTMVENRSTSSGGGGGAAECQSGSILYFNNSTLSNNQSTEIGGAINNYNGTVYFINSSATGNVAFGSFNGGAIGNNGGSVYILNSLFAHNYRKTTGNFSNPTGYVLDDFEPYSSPGGIKVYNSIYHATLPDGLGVNTGNIQYSGNSNGSNNTIFSGGLLSKITNNEGIEIGDPIFRPFLFNNQGSVAPTLKVGSFVTQSANLGVPTRFSNNNNSNPAIAYFSAGTWNNLLGTSAEGQEVLVDQVGGTRSATLPTRGAIETVLNQTLYIVKVNGASGGTVDGGTIYGDVYTSGSSVTLTAISNNGQQFVRWDYVAGGSGAASTANPYTFNVTQDITLVPIFQAATVGTYTITYIGNDNTGGTVPAGGTFTASTTISDPLTMVREGFDFVGWNTNSNGSGTSYASGSTYSLGTNLTLYASWQEIPVNEWKGTISSYWNIDGNWSLNTVPTTSSIVLIPSTTNQPFSTDNIEVRKITLNANAVLTLIPLHALKVNGNITNNGQIIFKSDATGTAVFDLFSGVISGSGTATVERYIPAKRAYRFISPSVTTTTSIRDNWQENGGTDGGLGTHITGLNGSANGFDSTTTNNPSLYTINHATGAWTAIANTNVNTLSAGTAYRLMVRGDRLTDLTTNTPTTSVTTLRATGVLKTGDYSPTLNQASEGYSFVGNPYQAPVDIKAVLATSTNMNSGVVYYWDPTLNARGAYVTRTLGTVNQNSPSSNFDQYLQPGQAVFVKKAATASAASLLFAESNKSVTNSAAGVFRTTTTEKFGTIRTNLRASIDNQWITIEGALAVFNPIYSWDVSQEDANKLSNLDEEVSLMQNNTSLAIACQSNPSPTNELPIRLNTTRHKNYQWQFELGNYSGPTPYLLDTQNNTYTQIDNNTIVPFTVNGQELTRFKIVFQNGTLSTTDFSNQVVFYPNPGVSGAARFYIQGITDAQVTLSTLMGQNIPVKTATIGKRMEVISKTSLSKGVYLVSITKEGKTSCVKWIVE